MYLHKVIKKKLKIFFFAILKVTVLDQDLDSDPLVRGMDPLAGSVPKCHGSPTLEIKLNNENTHKKSFFSWYSIFFAFWPHIIIHSD
jgi:hypothetical protein